MTHGLSHLSIFALLVTLSSPAWAENAPKQGEITMKKAQEIALKKVDGQIKSSEYEFEKGQNVYSFDINGRDGKIHEILVNAKSGKIVGNSIETASKEAAEEAADRKSN